MINNKKIIIVLPAYNASKTLEETYGALPFDIVDDVVLVDDASQDRTSKIAKKLGIKHIIRHERNMGYGANQKTCYSKALELGADVIVMLHPDYQYEPKLIPSMAGMISTGVFDCVLGSRILGTGALKGGMPVYKYIANRILTAFQNFVIPYKLSEYHTGYRAFSREVLTSLPLEENDDDFIFDNQMLVQIIAGGFTIGELTCPTLYADDSSSISLKRSVVYGLNVIYTTLEYKLHQIGWVKSTKFTLIEKKK